jgi:thiol-disulfide isomerase/thioredoxin
LAIEQNELVLIDFWASWCMPCNEEFPFLNNAYTQLSSRNFDIISISIDKKTDQWKKAIAQFNPLWQLQLIEPNAWESETI